MATSGWQGFTEEDARRVNLRRGAAARTRPAADLRSVLCRAGKHSVCQQAGCSCECHERKPSKMRNVRTQVDGIWFDSKAEAEYWLLLKARERRKEIRNLERQTKFALLCPSRDRAALHLVSEYVADYTFEAFEWGNWVRHVVDKKGPHRTRLYLLKRKWLELQEGIVIEEV